MNELSLRYVGLLAILLSVAACNAVGNLPKAATGPGQSFSTEASARQRKLWGPNVAAACPRRPRGAQCHALVRTDSPAFRNATSGPEGYTPQQLEQAYNLPSYSKGSGQIVAVIDAYDNPNVESDLAYYRSYFGLPAANFTKYNQDGETGNYPQADSNWGYEESLDVDMVSASCPNCTIYLIEANSFSAADMEAAEDEAVALGAHITSNSWGCNSPCGFVSSRFDTPGVTYVSGPDDQGYGVGAGTPNGFSSVVSVGGSSLYINSKSKRGFSEKAWPGTGSGCSNLRKPKWQHDPGCTGRTVNDVAADGDPSTAPAIYDTYAYGGWLLGGGTSTSTALVAGIFALAGNASSQDGGRTFWQKKHQNPSELYPVTKGADGVCSPSYLCTDGTKEYREYGGPTGWGTPNGIGAF